MTRRLLPLALALSALSCGHRASTVQFVAICAPKADCTFAAKCDLNYIGELRVDLSSLPAVSRNYFLFVEVHNQAVVNSDAGAGRINTLDALLQELTIEYDGGGVAGTTTLVQEEVPASGTSVVGLSVLTPDGVDTLAGNLGAAEAVVVAKVKGKGVFTDGSSFETSEFKIPFRVCRNCTDVCAAALGVACPHIGQAPATCAQ
jgi:hypothetical protein